MDMSKQDKILNKIYTKFSRIKVDDIFECTGATLTDIEVVVLNKKVNWDCTKTKLWHFM
jgi:hypothetical protein